MPSWDSGQSYDLYIRRRQSRISSELRLKSFVGSELDCFFPPLLDVRTASDVVDAAPIVFAATVQYPSTLLQECSHLRRACLAISILCAHVRQPNANGSSMGLQLFDLCQLHDRTTHILQPLLSEVGAGDMLREG